MTELLVNCVKPNLLIHIKELNMAGLMNPQDNKSDLLNAIRAAFGPPSGEIKSLQQRIEALTQSQLETVMTYAQLVKMAQNSFGKAQSYQQLVDSMYPMNALDLWLVSRVRQNRISRAKTKRTQEHIP